MCRGVEAAAAAKRWQLPALQNNARKPKTDERETLSIAKKEGRPKAAFATDRTSVRRQKPHMPPMPPPPGIAGAGSFGISATMASVVTRRPATEEASCS